MSLHTQKIVTAEKRKVWKTEASLILEAELIQNKKYGKSYMGHSVHINIKHANVNSASVLKK